MLFERAEINLTPEPNQTRFTLGSNTAGDGSIPTTKKTKTKSDKRTAHLQDRGRELLQVPGQQSRKILCLIL
jgi:hypothetical protein